MSRAPASRGLVGACAPAARSRRAPTRSQRGPIAILRAMREGPSRIRVAAVVFVAALTLHELRYLIAYGGGAGEAQSQQGHGYLPGLEMVALALLALAGADLLRALERARRRG